MSSARPCAPSPTADFTSPEMAASQQQSRSQDREYLRGLARAFAGAILFSLPLLMTMEMWWLGFYLDRWKLAQFILVNFAVLVGLSRVAGFEETRNWREDVHDALAAFAVGALASAAVLALFALIAPGMSTDEILGKIAIQAVPASFGAMIANKQLSGSGNDDQDRARPGPSYAGELFLMTAGALFLSFNVAPTEEMVLIAYRMSAWHGVVLVIVSILLIHAFVYGLGFAGQPDVGDARTVPLFVRFSIAGYAIAVLVSLYVLWTFGRTVGSSPAEIAMMTAVLAFPSTIGAAVARLVV
ncbi:membrane protein [Altererythrobacter sp. B11]|uniref:TIGR02587 family membrane protein n=1 Tax=Altererythrobacter sp. B11 TaxID=2060312 RepID=UPI000DC71640|nr:TIGR02587 family membrane protein [Altererythrobacter sp. B11]BBC72068.1 membrane protein [Altererythrobacter sp. B11]